MPDLISVVECKLMQTEIQSKNVTTIYVFQKWHIFLVISKAAREFVDSVLHRMFFEVQYDHIHFSSFIAF